METVALRYIPADAAQVKALEQALGIHPVLCRLLAQRGVLTLEQARAFLRPSLDDLRDPFLMKDMDKAAQRLAQAIARKEKILLYGDYDVDGATAIALMYRFLKPLHPYLDYYVPDRYEEGYGISHQGIAYAHECGANLIIAMDCGITAVEQAQHAKSCGIDLIICDHHLPGERLPDAVAVLNPKRSDCPYPFKDLCGGGVAFKLIQAYAQSSLAAGATVWQSLLEYLALGIAADIVPITDENRILAWHGLRQLNRSDRPGINALIEQSKRQRPLRINDIVFGLAPAINAAGRMSDAQQAVRLLLADDRTVAAEYARVLDYRNQLRREYDQRTAEEAQALFTPWEAERRSIVLYQPHWHKGVVGIVAARMVERFHRPAVLLTQSGHLATGSARSIPDVDLYEALSLCRNLLLNFGGHAHAAGLSLRPENVPAFSERFEAAVQTLMPQAPAGKTIDVHAELDLDGITPEFWNLLRRFEPFGPGNPTPVFLARGVRDTGYSRVLKGTHMQVSLKQGNSVFSGIAFGQSSQWELLSSRQPLDICYSIEESHWHGQAELKLQVRDIRAAG